MVISVTKIYVGAKAINEVKEKVAQLKNRVAEFLLVIANVATNMDNSLTKTSRDVMDELKELKEYVKVLYPLHLFCLCPLEGVFLRLTIVFKRLKIKT